MHVGNIPQIVASVSAINNTASGALEHSATHTPDANATAHAFPERNISNALRSAIVRRGFSCRKVCFTRRVRRRVVSVGFSACLNSVTTRETHRKSRRQHRTEKCTTFIPFTCGRMRWIVSRDRRNS